MSGDNQRCTRLVNEYAVHFVDDGEVELTLYAAVQGHDHVVAQIIKAELIIGSIRDISRVRSLAFRLIYAMDDQSYLESEVTVDLPHPLAIASSQIIVYRNDVNTLTCQSVQVYRQGGNQGFTLTCFHLSNTPLMQNDAALDLDREMFHTQDAPSCFTHCSEGFGQNIFQALSIRESAFEQISFRFQCGFTQALVFLIKLEYLLN